ncbi:RusA family crossover junction endodeoxyribonuclease [Burkholderia pseudomallei]|uniref:RusA family crossover junction endodeoxyribonuclease n=1 Tax=Burkholderia pseudomallei TaxID=28450 RepID=UPI00015F7D76|nr:RusA family crossover junction endodeoxyribonuclease [Burkholderia pseudomallei]AJX59848.1 endodeoxyribonuclease RusA family protein [Burkholderia pseudomallei Pasteur 52237]EDO95624.1 holliday junction resolvase [Burkholderia pseudomallei Pasteur 52237]MWA16548.1 RusA family crossover junction endodeoxyribonuclease [Burkholderia pseudomallei]VBQ81178.1 endodeoxyribonuclease RusA [Burkholderia pseudomallei]
MNGEVHITLPFAAIGKGRPRVYRGIASTPPKTRAYEHQVATLARAAMRGRLPFDGPIRVLIEIDVEIPKTWPKYRRADALAGRVWPSVKPDIDNCAKAILDGMNGIAYRDDTQIVIALLSKRYASDAQVRIAVEEIAGQTAQKSAQRRANPANEGITGDIGHEAAH